MKDEIGMIMKDVEKNTKAPLLVNVISKRVRQLMRGEKALVDTRSLKDYVQIAYKEFAAGKLIIEEEKDAVQVAKNLKSDSDKQ